jgi:SAM-dependent methyltransferase
MDVREWMKSGARIGWIRALSARYADWRFKRWKSRNPDRDFAEFYVDDVVAKINKGSGHPTLGAKGFRSGKNRSVEWDRKSFASRGADQWRYYARVTGLAPGKRCVDYGCGSLRVGQHAIRELNAGDYWGLDISDSFYESGRQLLDPDLIMAKSPRFSVIDDALLDHVRDWRCDAIFANAVIQHVPQSELHIFFKRIAKLVAPGAIAAIVFIGGTSIERVKAMSWAYPDDLLTDAVTDADDELEAECFPIEGEDAKAFNGKRRLLRIRRKALV